MLKSLSLKFGGHRDLQYHPSDFENFLPWACKELEVDAVPIIKRIESDIQHHSSSSIQSRKLISKPSVSSTKCKQTQITPSPSSSVSESPSVPKIAMTCVHNINNQLVKIKFSNNRIIPACLFKVISLALPFHKHVTAIHIGGGLQKNSLSEFCNTVATTNITEVVLDNTMLLNMDVDILLEENLQLKHLSLARCTINDNMVEKLALKITYPCTAARNLCVLNLSSNKITDIGAKYIGDALRANSLLAYFNLSGNMITDTGAESILNSLKEFPMTADEIYAKKLRHLTYKRQEEHLETNDSGNAEVKAVKMKKIRTVTTAKKPKLTELTSQSSNQTIHSMITDIVRFDKEENKHKNTISPYTDPFRKENTIQKDDITYCLGNNTLCYINLAYNNLGYFTLKRLSVILRYQAELDRHPRGLVNVCIEGNNMPQYCEELKEITSKIEAGIRMNIRSVGKTISRKPSTIR